ncbi:hypothetical protein AB4851_24065 [Burkholderia sp. 22PA0099]
MIAEEIEHAWAEWLDKTIDITSAASRKGESSGQEFVGAPVA